MSGPGSGSSTGTFTTARVFPYAAPKTGRYLIGTGAGDESSAIQAVLDAAGPEEIVRLYGTFTTGSTITVKGNLDASGAVISYSGAGVAVQVGVSASVTFRKTVILPRVINANKSGTGWGSVAGSTGVLILNWYSGQVVIPHVQSFEVGLNTRGGLAKGCVYSTINIGHLDNNKVNHLLSVDTGGWSNQQTFIGGRFSHNSGEGTSVSGVRHIQMPTGLPNPPNNNLWVNPSLEGDVAEYQVEMAGSANMIQNGRWEVSTGGRVWFRADAVDNLILYGYQSYSIVPTREAGSARNHILTPRSWTMGLSGKAIITENGTSGANPVLTVMDAGGISAGADPDTAFCARIGAKTSGYKRAADGFERLRLDHENARLYFGAGTAALARYLGNLGSTAISVNGGNLVPGADNTLDLGQASFLWRYIRAATAVQTGAMDTASRPAAATAGAGAHVLDTTLGRPVWSDGSSWLDPVGAALSAAAGNPGAWVPADNGLIAGDVDPILSSSNYTLASAGVLYLRKIKMSVTSAITNVLLYVNTAGAGLSNCYVAVFNAAGAQLGGTSADQSTAWQSTGTKTIALGTPSSSVAAGSWVYVAILAGAGSTLPNFRAFSSAIHAFGLTTGSQYRWGNTGSGLTAMPSSITPGGISNTSGAAPMVGLS